MIERDSRAISTGADTVLFLGLGDGENSPS